MAKNDNIQMSENLIEEETKMQMMMTGQERVEKLKK